MKKTLFTIENNTTSYIGYTSGRLWNGWATPYFEFAEALQIMAYYNNNSDTSMEYSSETDCFCIAETEYTDGVIWKGENIQTEEGIKHLYGIGAYYWIWEAIDFDDIKYLAEAIDEFIYDYDTYGYRDVGIDREEMIEELKNKMLDLNVLQQVYNIWQNEELSPDERFDKLSRLL